VWEMQIKHQLGKLHIVPTLQRGNYKVIMTTPKLILLLGYGNPSRGDDALGVLLLEQLPIACLQAVELLTNFQLQIEHALDLKQWQLANK
ncbi:MAG: HoxW protein, partial [Methylococcaceae bacterium NSP1-2]